MTKEELQSLLDKYLIGTITPEEQHLLNRWYEGLDKGPYPAALSKIEEEALKSKLWNEILPESIHAKGRAVDNVSQVKAGDSVLESSLDGRSIPIWRTLLRIGIAASIIIVLGIVYNQYKHEINHTLNIPIVFRGTSDDDNILYTNRSGQIERIDLTDGSKIFLYPGSWLKYNRQFTSKKREVQLSGEAFFKIQHESDRPFIVLADKTITTVLGTSFIIKAYPNAKSVVVAVKTGKVSVQVPDSSQSNQNEAIPAEVMTLNPQQQAVYLRDTQMLTKENVLSSKPIVASQLVFEEKTVPEVLTALGNIHNVGMIYDMEHLKECTVTVTFYNETLEQKLDLLCKILGATYERVDNQIILFSKGCHK
ncbi:FecR family protein [Xanthocytophaga agilis]|uniref:FecR family protein n=1 Tax=Xanthocytophaga agilis TaxID=3048010 RepID=A0AAE3RBA1_9BACT|nr:FecR family protein [Xanthocytophaga agilis]MDJ1504247.1 FecR family protein [Xanthocytophaga agilis]